MVFCGFVLLWVTLGWFGCVLVCVGRFSSVGVVLVVGHEKCSYSRFCDGGFGWQQSYERALSFLELLMDAKLLDLAVTGPVDALAGLKEVRVTIANCVLDRLPEVRVTGPVDALPALKVVCSNKVKCKMEELIKVGVD